MPFEWFPYKSPNFPKNLMAGQIEIQKLDFETYKLLSCAHGLMKFRAVAEQHCRDDQNHGTAYMQIYNSKLKLSDISQIFEEWADPKADTFYAERTRSVRQISCFMKHFVHLSELEFAKPDPSRVQFLAIYDTLQLVVPILDDTMSFRNLSFAYGYDSTVDHDGVEYDTLVVRGGVVPLKRGTRNSNLDTLVQDKIVWDKARGYLLNIGYTLLRETLAKNSKY